MRSIRIWWKIFTFVHFVGSTCAKWTHCFFSINFIYGQPFLSSVIFKLYQRIKIQTICKRIVIKRCELMIYLLCVIHLALSQLEVHGSVHFIWKSKNFIYLVNRSWNIIMTDSWLGIGHLCDPIFKKCWNQNPNNAGINIQIMLALISK